MTKKNYNSFSIYGHNPNALAVGSLQGSSSGCCSQYSSTKSFSRDSSSKFSLDVVSSIKLSVVLYEESFETDGYHHSCQNHQCKKYNNPSIIIFILLIKLDHD